MNIEKFLRAAEVQRWHTVHATKTQTVAEHQWNVWVIARAIYDMLFPIPHNSDESALVSTLALTHDVHEIVVGDIPSTGKDLMSITEENALEEYEHRVMRTQFGINPAANRGTLAEAIVKLADRVEAAHFARKYVTTPGVRGSTTLAVTQQFAVCVDMAPHLSWGKIASDVINLLLPEREDEE